MSDSSQFIVAAIELRKIVLMHKVCVKSFQTVFIVTIT